MSESVAHRVESLRLTATMVLRVVAAIAFAGAAVHAVNSVSSYMYYAANPASLGGASYSWYDWAIPPAAYLGASIALWGATPWIAARAVSVPDRMCPKCNYVLQGKAFDRCPECGLYLGSDFMDPPVESKDTLA